MNGGTAVCPRALYRAATCLAVLLPAFFASPSFAQTESDLGSLRASLRAGKYPDVERRTRSFLERTPLATGADSLRAAELLDILAEVLRRGGKAADPEAEAVCLRAVEIKERMLPSNDARIATSRNNLGALYYARGEYQQALEQLNRALKLREDALGPNDPDVAATLLLIAGVQSALGEDAKARSLVERAVALQEAALGPDNPDLAWGLNSLGVLDFNEGDYVQAEQLQERALGIFQRAYGPDHAMVGTCLHNLAALQYAMGDYRESRDGFERALGIRERALGHENVFVSYTLTGLAMDLEALRDYKGARDKYEQALRVQEKLYGPSNDEVGWTLMRLGELQIELGNHSKARALLRQALANLEGGLGEDHPYVAEALVGLAAATADSSGADSTRALFERALSIQEGVLGPTHPEVGVTFGRLGRFLAGAGDSAGAVDAALRADAIFRDHLRLTCRSLPERRAMGYAASRTPGRSLALAILARSPHQAPGTVARVWDSVIRSRALVLDEVAARTRLVGDLAQLAKALDESRQRLANLLVRGAVDQDPERYRAMVEAARRETERAEGALAGASAEFRSDRARGDIGWLEVASSLPRKAALVAFVVYGEGSERAYLALALSAGEREPIAIRLGRAAELDALVSRWDTAIAGGARIPEAGLASAERECSKAGTELRARVWDPILTQLGPAELVYIVPDGALHLVSWAALPSAKGGYIVEDGPLLHILSTERDLVGSGARHRSGAGLLALGGASFDEAVAGSAGKTQPDARHADAGVVRGISTDCEEFSSARFEPLPQSALEVREIASIWPSPDDATVLTGADASESAFKRLSPGRRVLHLATHGFFLRESCTSAEPGSRGIGGIATDAGPRVPAPDDDNFLLLAGLALAGANRRSSAESGEDDGVLMAQEISSLDLGGVEWAVLSGCDTGVGEIRAGEGVLGLQRAFQVAGAGTVIMSLWPVEDEAARRWMAALYTARLRQRKQTDEAVRDAYLSVLRDRRAQGRSTHPFYWAAFVAAGDWR